MNTVLKYAIAACVLIAAGVLAFVLPTQRSSLAFGDVLKKVQDANAIRFKIVTTVNTPDGKPQTVEGTVVCTSSRMRQEIKGMTSIIDLQKGEMINLLDAQKQGMRLKMSKVPAEARNLNLLSSFRSLKAEQGKDLGTQVLDGKKLHVFEVINQQQNMKVWADPTSGLPVRIESKVDMPMAPKAKGVMTNFEWNVPVETVNAMLEVPAGYTVKDFSIDASPATETDLLATLRAIASANNGQFPEELNFAAIGKAAVRQFAGTTKPSTTNPSTHPSVFGVPQEVMDKAMAVSRGMAFIVPTNGTDWRYAGKGRSMTDGEANPILWYLPTGAAKYRVIDSTLKVTDVAKDALPAVESVSLGSGLMTMTPSTTAPAPAIAPPAKTEQ